MKCNVGGIDRVLRVLVGAILLIMTASNLIGVWGWIGVLPFATGVIRICPLYSILDLSTSGSREV